MYKSIRDVVPGDVILERTGGKTEVKKVEVGPPGCLTKVHINGNHCYEGFSEVRVSGEPTFDEEPSYNA